MKVLKLFMNTRSQEQPANTYPYGKNGIQFELNGSGFNEPGFLKLAAAVVPYTLMGVIETDSKPVLFSTDNSNSAIGYFNPITKLYEPIVDDDRDIYWGIDGKLNFSMDFYITGEAQRNYKGEMVIAFTDKRNFPSFPYYLNCDKPNLTRIDDIRLSPFYIPPTIELSESSGGILDPGTYYVSGVYEKNDGTTTPHFEISEGITISPGTFNTTSDKAILVTVTNVDTNYDFIRLTIISKIKGITTAVELSDAVSLVGGTLQIFYTGENLSETITVQEVLTPPAIYSKVGTFGQLNDSLYAADLEKEPDLDDLQPYASMVGVSWVSELIDATSPPLEHRNGTKRSFMHQEVYALYIQYKKTRGGYTKSFTIAGLPLLPDDLVTSTEASTGGSPTSVPKYKIEDTIPIFDLATKTGKPGKWKNEIETYPNTDQFNSSFLGGPDLRNQPVLHHRMPSLRWCKANLYSGVQDYGKTKLDLLGIKISNVSIPDKYADVINGYRILYARRNSTNSTINGQAVLMHGTVSRLEVGIPTGVANIYTTGGNWTSGVIANDYDENNELVQVRKDTFRLHPFDVLFNRPAMTPKFISAQFKFRRDHLDTEGYYEDGSANGEYNAPTVHLVDYTLGIDPLSIPAGRTTRYINLGFYLEQGFSLNKFNNNHHETCYAGTLLGTDWPLDSNDASIRLRGAGYTEVGLGSAGFEETYLVNLVSLKTDIYSNFYSQTLVSAGAGRALDDFTTFWGGDTFNCDYTFHTYGRHDKIDTNGDGIKGKKVIRRFVCESASNIHLRYEVPGNEYSKWYPRTSIVGSDPDQCYITRFDRSKNPNDFGYTKDLNALNDFISSTIFNPFLEQIYQFPYRIHRFGKVGRQNKFRNWRSSLPLDYYECQKNMGRIIHLEGMNDRLLIHHENALFRTQDKAQLEGGELSITLGTGDIFKFEPQQPVDSKLGYAGTQHDLACVRTPFGYVFCDAKQGEIFLYNEDVVNIGADISNFLRDYLKGLTEKNNYTGNGLTIGYDPDYKRILFTAKNKKKPLTNIKTFEDTNAFFDGLAVDDLVDYNGRLIKYKGLNDAGLSGFDCPEDPVAPPDIIWVPDTWICEIDTPVNPIMLIGAFSSLSSPGALLYKPSTNEMFVGDYDDTGGAIYKINLTTGAKDHTIFPFAYEAYSVLRDTIRRRFYICGKDTSGLRVYDIETDSSYFAGYGSGGTFSRLKMWMIKNFIYALDVGTNSIYEIDLDVVIVGAVHDISLIPGSTIYMATTGFELMEVNNNILVLPNKSPAGVIAVYSLDLLTLITTILLPGAAIMGDFGGNLYVTSCFYDKDNDKLYVYDTGSVVLHVIKASTFEVITSTSIVLGTGAGYDYGTVEYSLDPITGELYMNFAIRETTENITAQRIYTINRATGNILVKYDGLIIIGELEREGTTPYLWAARPLLKKAFSPGGDWNIDGIISKYSH